MIEFDSEAAKTIFDDERPQQGEQKGDSDSGTAEAENGRMYIEADSGASLEHLIY